MFLAKTFFAPEAQNDSLWAFLGSPLGLLLLWLLLINLFTFCAFGADKWKAKRKERRPETRRIPERNLFLSALLGGSAGALLGMKVFHHKTLHRTFTIGIPAILILQLVLALGLTVYFNFFH